MNPSLHRPGHVSMSRRVRVAPCAYIISLILIVLMLSYSLPRLSSRSRTWVVLYVVITQAALGWRIFWSSRKEIGLSRVKRNPIIANVQGRRDAYSSSNPVDT
ncbi:uncharacterized protein BT62DRAFT_749351 [Guyanagaster necrorhizus]|uniref:Uncharacterized protein n=1 Tax=Guyanagaster necrorhizus TaxID=856835 RepID=A0A9P8AUG4_9AGAR|nr:uncharacterized protein BT62DRAFT_749351 [Guyanagaster necrorhizus MCA 3950]KAG7448026.1 hypothetical protein BT62DRAFT_749351 [Guyanagaster necrorhizus MCA 3950]